MRGIIGIVLGAVTGAVIWWWVGSGTSPTHAAPASLVGRPEQVILVPAGGHGEVVLMSTYRGYESPEVAAKHVFTNMLLHWEATIPPGARLQLEVRTRNDAQGWGDWFEVPESNDLALPADRDDSHWSAILYVGEGMRFWQVRANTQGAPDGQQPEIRRIEVHTVDARFGPRDPRPVINPGPNPPRTVALPAGLSRPPVVSRTAWGCPDGQGSRATPAYRFVTHLIVHHTAESNTLRSGEQTWSDRVRAIWSFHTFSRGWGDIGYNFLIAPDGTIYEGRGGGDNVVGFHDTANYGSMGVALIGTYEAVEPTAVALESLVSLLAWKANQNDIAPKGSSYYHGCYLSPYCSAPNAVVMNIAGHIHVTPGRTACPGQRVINLLPTIRNRVQAYIDEGGEHPRRPDNGDLLIEELEDSFTPSRANWYRAPCGDNGHTFYTYATDTSQESENWARWTPTIPKQGNYRVYVAIPQGCGLGTPPYATTNAPYVIHSAGGVITKSVDQNTTEPWVDLGVYTFAAGTNGYVELSDLTGEPYSLRRVIFFDSIKWIPEEQTIPTADIELRDVSYHPTTIPAGKLLQVVFTVYNGSKDVLYGQGPQATLRQSGEFDPYDGYVYDERECFLGSPEQNYPVYPKEHNRYRVTLGPVDREVVCAGNSGGYPWRWGLNEPLQPGSTATITGYVRFHQPGSVTLQAGLIQEYVKYHTKGFATKTITITEEDQPPSITRFDALLRPLAQVYRLGEVPKNFLSRAPDPLSLIRATYLGDFPWDGSIRTWHDGAGPIGGGGGALLIEQVRTFVAPVSGTYTFQTTSYGGSWLWVDRQEVVVNRGSKPPDMYQTMTGTIALEVGPHVLAFRCYELSGIGTSGSAGYAIQYPGTPYFVPLPDGPGGTAKVRMGTFITTPTITLAADDMGGSGVNRIRYWWEGEKPQEQRTMTGTLVLGPFGNGRYHLHYEAFDLAGNRSEQGELRFTVAIGDKPKFWLFLPNVRR